MAIELPLFYEALAPNVQLPNGYPGIEGALSKLDLSELLSAPNRDLIIRGITDASTAGFVIGRGTIAPFFAGQGFRVIFIAFTSAEDGATIDIPIDSIPSPLSVYQFGITPIVPYGEYGSVFTASFSLSKILADGTEEDADAPAPIAYDATDFTASNPSSASSWCEFDVSDAQALRLTINDPDGSTGEGVDRAPVLVEAIVSTGVWPSS